MLLTNNKSKRDAGSQSLPRCGPECRTVGAAGAEETPAEALVAHLPGSRRQRSVGSTGFGAAIISFAKKHRQ